MKQINKFTKIILVVALLFSQFGNAAKVLADEITNRDLNVSIQELMDENNSIKGYTITYSSLNKNYDETEVIDEEEVDKTYNVVFTSSFTYLDDTTTSEKVETVENVTGKTLNSTESTYELNLSSNYNGKLNLNVKVLDNEEEIYNNDINYEINSIKSGITGKLNKNINPTNEEEGKGTYDVNTATTYMNSLTILTGDLNPNSSYVIIYTDGTESEEMTADQLLTYEINGSSIDLTDKLAGNYSITDNIKLKELTNGEVVNTYEYSYEASINYEGEVDNDTLFSEMYGLNFSNEYLVLTANNLINEEEVIPTVKDIVEGLNIDATIEITDNEGNVLDLEDSEILASQLKNDYKITFTSGNAVTYNVVVVGDATSDNNFDKEDVIKTIDSYLDDEKLIPMDLTEKENSEDEEEIGTITFEDIALLNRLLNKGVDFTENEGLTLGFGEVPAEVYVGDKIEMTVLINSANVEDYINGLDGLLNLNENIELAEVKFNDNQIGSYREDGHFVVVNPNMKNGEVLVTFVFNATKEGKATINLSGSIAKEENVSEIEELSAEINVIRNVSSNNYLDSLTSDSGEFDKPFDKDVTEYTLTVPYDTKTVILSGALGDIYSSVTGLTEYVLNGDKTVATITVTAEDGSTRTYIINIVKESAPAPIAYYPSNDNYLKELSIDGYEIDFDKNVLKYIINVENDVNSLDIKAIANDSKSSVLITGNENFKVGENVVTITVKAENGDIKEYKIIVNKKDKEKTTLLDEEKGNSTVEKIVIIGLIILVVLGLLYLIFKKDEEDEKQK